MRKINTFVLNNERECEAGMNGARQFVEVWKISQKFSEKHLAEVGGLVHSLHSELMLHDSIPAMFYSIVWIGVGGRAAGHKMWMWRIKNWQRKSKTKKKKKKKYSKNASGKVGLYREDLRRYMKSISGNWEIRKVSYKWTWDKERGPAKECVKRKGQGARRMRRAWRRSLKLNASSDYADRAETRQGEEKNEKPRNTAMSLPEATGRNGCLFFLRKSTNFWPISTSSSSKGPSMQESGSELMLATEGLALPEMAGTRR